MSRTNEKKRVKKKSAERLVGLLPFFFFFLDAGSRYSRLYRDIAQLGTHGLAIGVCRNTMVCIVI